MRVDAHTHFLPRGYEALLREWGKAVRIEDRDESSVIVHEHGTLPLSPGFRDVDARVEWMAEHGIDWTVVSVSTPNPNEGPFSVKESTKLVRAINDGYADLQYDHPETIAALGMLPLRSTEAALVELDHIVDRGLAGVALPTTVRGEKLSVPRLKPVFDRLEQTDLPAFIHPKPNALSKTLDEGEWPMNPLAVFPTETTVQLARLAFDGFFDDHNFDLVIAHLGGALPYLTGRLERGRQFFTLEGPPAMPVINILKRFYYDTISYHPPAIHAAIETVGADRLLFGTDYPFGHADAPATLAAIKDAVPTDAQGDVLGETAAVVFDL